MGWGSGIRNDLISDPGSGSRGQKASRPGSGLEIVHIVALNYLF
jgi:hypothetical protein